MFSTSPDLSCEEEEVISDRKRLYLGERRKDVVIVKEEGEREKNKKGKRRITTEENRMILEKENHVEIMIKKEFNKMKEAKGSGDEDGGREEREAK